jgi:hypothetical protein
MELDLQSLFGLLCTSSHCCTHLLRPRNSPPHPAFGLVYECAIGQPRSTTSLCNPLVWSYCTGSNFNSDKINTFCGTPYP